MTFCVYITRTFWVVSTLQKRNRNAESITLAQCWVYPTIFCVIFFTTDCSGVYNCICISRSIYTVVFITTIFQSKSQEIPLQQLLTMPEASWTFVLMLITYINNWKIGLWSALKIFKFQVLIECGFFPVSNHKTDLNNSTTM